MKRAVLMAALCLAGLTTAQTVTWSKVPGGVAVAADAADNVFTARWDCSMAGAIHVAKRDAQGRLLWEVRYDNSDTDAHNFATGVGTDAAGNVLVSANSILMKFAPDGSAAWVWFDPIGLGWPPTMKFTPDGALIVSARVL